MAVTAAVDSVLFTALGAPDEGFFQLGANVKYFDDVGGTDTALVNVNVAVGAAAGDINNTLVNEAIRLAPAGFEVTEEDVLIPVYTTGSAQF